MRQLPALFSTEMVKALLENRKTMTRRTKGLEGINKEPDKYILNGFNDGVFEFNRINSAILIPELIVSKTKGSIIYPVKPRYQVGDQLWVKETYYAFGYWQETGEKTKVGYLDKYEFIDLTPWREYKYRYEVQSEMPCKILNQYGSDKIHGLSGWFKRPSLFMPKSAARIWLECTGVRCERLQDITEADAIAEGVQEFGSLTKRYIDYCPQNHYTKDELKSGYIFEPTAVYSFMTLWESINGIESVRLNPWVFIYEFKRIEKP